MKSQGFLADHGLSVRQRTSAVTKFGRAEAIALARNVKRLVFIRGQAVMSTRVTRRTPSDDAVASLLLGPTGNLRAPAVRAGDTLIVGFHEDAYRELFT